MRRIGICSGVAALVLALGAGARADARKDDKGDVVKEGKVLVVRGLEGGEPQITDEASQRWMIVGPLRDEALNLDGHKLRVWANVTGQKKLTMRTLLVKRYEILDSGGRRPVVGLLQRDAPLALSLDRKEGKLEVKGPRPLLVQLDKKVGCKVWLVGDLEGKAIKTFKFGSISCKKDKPALKPKSDAVKPRPEKERKR
jgi:hypothetical protein